MFPCFQNFQMKPSTPEAVYLCMAAVGGLYCKVTKADVVAKHLLHTARRHLLTMVRKVLPGLGAYTCLYLLRLVIQWLNKSAIGAH